MSWTGSIKSIGFAIGLPVILIVIWFLATAGGANFFVPTPEALVQEFYSVWFSDRFFTDVLPSISRLLFGLAGAIVLGITFGLVIGSVRWLRIATEPLLEFFRATPPIVLIPILMLLIGISDTMRVIVIISGCVWPILLNTIAGVRAVDPVLTDTAHTYGLTGFARIRHLVIPAASPQIMTGVRQSLSIGLILMVISEMFAASSGLGFSIIQFQRAFAIPAMWSGIVLLGLIGVVLALVFSFVQRRVLRWYYGLKEVESGN